MDMEIYREEIEATKLAASTIQYVGISIKQTLLKAIDKQRNFYIDFNDNRYLYAALILIQVYLEMGFDYEENSTLYNSILLELKTDKKKIFPRNFYCSEKISLTKSGVRSMIRKWTPSKYHTNSIDTVVEDILYKVKHNIQGIYFYHSNNNPNKEKYADDIYELVINDRETFFHDIKMRKYYTFIL